MSDRIFKDGLIFPEDYKPSFFLYKDLCEKCPYNCENILPGSSMCIEKRKGKKNDTEHNR